MPLYTHLSSLQAVKDQAQIENASSFMATYNSLDFLDEKTWVLLHHFCANHNDLRTEIFSKLQELIAQNRESTHAMQARLFLLSQPDFVPDETIFQPILDSNDYWAWFALLTHSEFKIENFNCEKIQGNFVAAITQVDSTYDCLFKAFLAVSKVDIAEKQILLNNFSKLNINLTQCPIEGLRSILPFIVSTNQETKQIIVLNEASKKFLCHLIHALFTQWSIGYRTEKERQTYEKKANGNDSSELAQRTRVDQDKWSARIIQQNFVALLQAFPQFSEWENSLAELCREKLNVSFSYCSYNFIGILDSSLFKTIDNSAIDWLMTLTIFKEFIWLKDDEFTTERFFQAIFNSDNQYLYSKVTTLDLEHPDSPMFMAMTRKESYRSLNVDMINEFFKKKIDSINNVLLLSASSEFRDFDYIKNLPVLKEFLSSHEYFTVKQLDKLMQAVDVKEILKITQEMVKNFHSQAFIVRLMTYHSTAIESLLKDLFPEKYSLTPLSDLQGYPESNRVYIGNNGDTIKVVVKHYINGNTANLPYNEKGKFKSEFGQDFTETLLEDSSGHQRILDVLIAVFPAVKDVISPQDMNDEKTQALRNGAQIKIDQIFKLSKIVRRKSLEDYKSLKENPIFKRLAIRYRASKYIGREESWAVAQQLCLRYIDENLSALLNADSERTNSLRRIPFLWPAYVEIAFGNTAKEEDKQWHIDKINQFQYWVHKELFHIPRRKISSVLEPKAIGAKKFAQTLLCSLEQNIVNKIFEGAKKGYKDIAAIAEVELDKDSQDFIEESSIDEEVLIKFKQKLNSQENDIEELREIFECYIELYDDAFVRIVNNTSSNQAGESSKIFSILTKLNDYAQINENELKAVLNDLPVEKYYQDSSQAFKDLRFPRIAQMKDLEYLFDQPLEKLKMLDKAEIQDSKTFLSALKNHYASRIKDELSTKSEISGERIERIANLGRLLSEAEQKELYQNTTYILFRLQNCLMKYEHQQTKNIERGLGKDLKKEMKMKFIDWLIQNLSKIESGGFSKGRSCPMISAYNTLRVSKNACYDVKIIASWLRDVIFHNSPKLQSARHGFGMFDSTVNGRKGSRTAETLALLQPELIEKIFKGSGFSSEELFARAYPGRKFDLGEEYIQTNSDAVSRGELRSEVRQR